MPVAAAAAAATGMAAGTLILAGILAMVVLVALGFTAWRRGTVKIKIGLGTLAAVELELKL
jgi:hypothetical protein